MNEVAVEMPRYKCHKEVWALKIADLEDRRARLRIGRLAVTASC